MLNDKSSFNFWPSFADLMLSLVLVVLIILFVVSKLIASGTENLDRARESQKSIAAAIQHQIGGKYSVKIISDMDSREAIAEAKKSSADIMVINKLDRQTITFSDKILFDTNQSDLKTEGALALDGIGPVIRNNLPDISEIQIQGHADIKGNDNINLIVASMRAMEVYRYLQHTVGIDPSACLMSATSFGAYKPVGREAGADYSRERLLYDNANADMMAKNRRIEIVLFYKNELTR